MVYKIETTNKLRHCDTTHLGDLLRFPSVAHPLPIRCPWATQCYPCATHTHTHTHIFFIIIICFLNNLLLFFSSTNYPTNSISFKTILTLFLILTTFTFHYNGLTIIFLLLALIIATFAAPMAPLMASLFSIALIAFLLTTFHAAAIHIILSLLMIFLLLTYGYSFLT